jgi:hypothetical protein
MRNGCETGRGHTEKSSTSPVVLNPKAQTTIDATNAIDPSTVFRVPGHLTRPTSFPTIDAWMMNKGNQMRLGLSLK